ncbi:DUF998 domain-containing protein [Nocardia sp. NBC_01009]|uniref:DUF998 domain-containing protein n=1 Tax=Nocardia sp. NBC_01009 TaxID=2975996 RepID=UPI003865A1D3
MPSTVRPPPTVNQAIGRLITRRSGPQRAAFLVTGTLFIPAGLRRSFTDGPGRVWAPRLVAVFGAGLIAAGAFVADPANGYPVGAVERELRLRYRFGTAVARWFGRSVRVRVCRRRGR